MWSAALLRRFSSAIDCLLSTIRYQRLSPTRADLEAAPKGAFGKIR
jgi:hypothetical protein